MADPETPLDDELLSAYLDDELAAAERARVEERLAGDPAARTLLDELRAVSQAVHELPAEKLDGDLRDTILRRAERAMLLSSEGPPDGEPASAGGASVDRRAEPTRFSIGRTPRGWLWAGMAIAAALVLMIYSPQVDHDQGVPARVAARSEDTPESTAKPAADRLELRALSRESEIAKDIDAPLARADAAADDMSPSASRDVTGFSASTPAPAATARPANADVERLAEPHSGSLEFTDDELVRRESVADGSTPAIAAEEFRRSAPAPTSGREDALGRSGGVGGVVAESEVPSSPQTEFERGDFELLVVNLRCPSQAIEDKALDDALYKCNITVEEPEAASEESLARNLRSSEGTASRVRFQRETAATAAQFGAKPQPAEVVVVEAPPAQIKQCLDEIGADVQNFRGIVVEEPSAAADHVAKEESEAASKKRLAGVNWQQYNRGDVPQQQKLERGANNYFYFQTDGGQIVLEPAGSDKPAPAESETLAEEQSSSGSERGRAVRLRSLGEVEQQRQITDLSKLGDQAVAVAQPAEDTKLGLARRGPVMLPKAKANMLQVLFILHADDEVTSSTASAPTQGLQKQD